jgi:putative transposase
MNPPKFCEEDYIGFLTASPEIFTCTEAERVRSGQENAPCHDSVNRLPHRIRASAAALRKEAVPFVSLKKGVLIPDDSTSDKPYAREIGLVSRHWSGKHNAVVKGISLLTLLWTDGDAHIPCDYRIYCKDQDSKTKNDHFADMPYKAEVQGFEPSCVLFDSWYSASPNNLKKIRSFGWHWLTRFKSDRLVNPDGKGNIPLSEAKSRKPAPLFILKVTVLSKYSGLLSETMTPNTGQPITPTRMTLPVSDFPNFHGKSENIIGDSDSFAERNGLRSEPPKPSGIISVLL